MGKIAIVSTDGHAATPPLEAFRPYLDSARHVAFDDLLADSNAMLTVHFFDVLDPELAKQYKKTVDDNGAFEGRWDPVRRPETLHADGIVAELLFPDGAPFGAGGRSSARTFYPHHQELAGARASRTEAPVRTVTAEETET